MENTFLKSKDIQELANIVNCHRYLSKIIMGQGFVKRPSFFSSQNVHRKVQKPSKSILSVYFAIRKFSRVIDSIL